MNYAVITKETESLDDGYGGHYQKHYSQFREFDTQEAMLNWVEDNDTRQYSRVTVTKIIEFNELKVKRALKVC